MASRTASFVSRSFTKSSIARLVTKQLRGHLARSTIFSIASACSGAEMSIRSTRIARSIKKYYFLDHCESNGPSFRCTFRINDTSGATILRMIPIFINYPWNIAKSGII